MLDILIRDAMVIDGSGRDSYRGTVGIKGDRIVLNCQGAEAAQVIEGAGLYLAPGFIDSHSHSDYILSEDFAQLIKISQGVTTEISGNCGISPAPVGPGRVQLVQELINKSETDFPAEMETWTSYEKYLEYLRAAPRLTNSCSYVGLGSLRAAVMGFENRRPTQQELERMKELLEEAMKLGAMGVSTGLVYPPCCYAQLDEIVELAKVAKKYGGIYATHMRNESDGVVEAVQEAIEVGRQSGCTVVISHHKILGKSNWGLQKQTLKLIEDANAEGIDVLCDQYPYTRNMTGLAVCVPPVYYNEGISMLAQRLGDPAFRRRLKAEMQQTPPTYDNYYQNAGGWEGVLVCSAPSTKEAEGLTIHEYARQIGKDEFEAYFDILEKNKGQTLGVYSSMCEQDVFEIALAPNTVVGSDGIPTSLTNMTHPRTFGTFPRAICYYHKEKGLMTLEQVIHKMTGKTAERLRIPQRGRIEDGYFADLVIFNYEKLKDNATYTEPTKFADGIEYVIVNGRIAYQDKHLTGARSGRLLYSSR